MKVLYYVAILVVLSLIIGLPYVLPVSNMPHGLPALAKIPAKAKYYITDESRKTTQFFVAEDWPIVKEWDIDLIWVDTNADVVGIERKGKCGTIKFKTTEFIDKENFEDGEYLGRKEYTCDHFHWTLNHELER